MYPATTAAVRPPAADHAPTPSADKAGLGSGESRYVTAQAPLVDGGWAGV